MWQQYHHHSMKKYSRTVLGMHRKQGGFTLLLAALVSSIVLSLGAAIFQIAQKQIILSGIGRDSQFAFYVADAAAECALYWDFRFAYFAPTSPATVVDPDPRCDGQAMKVTGRPTNPPYHPYTMTWEKMNFFTDVSPTGGYCAEVYVKKCQGTFAATGACTSGGATDPISTIIHADGYSVPCAQIGTSPRALQRSVELHY